MDEIERLKTRLAEAERDGREHVEIDLEQLRDLLFAADRVRFWQRATEGASERVRDGSSNIHDVLPRLFGPAPDARKTTKKDARGALLRYAYLTGQLAAPLCVSGPDHDWTKPPSPPIKRRAALEIVADEFGWESLRAARASLDRLQDRIKSARLSGLPESPLLPIVRLPADPK